MENTPCETVPSNTSHQIQGGNSFIQDSHCQIEQEISTDQTTEQIVGNHVEDDVQLLDQSSFNTSHNSYTIAYKLAVLDWYHANGENKTLTSKHFGVARKRIRDWSLMEDQLRSMPQTSRFRKRNPPCKNHSRRPPGSTDLDQAILNWYKQQRESGVVVYSRQIRAKALELSPQCGLPETFKASTQWLHNWKKRYAADIKEWSDLDESVVSDDVGNTVTLASDFEEHLRRLEQVGADLAAGQDDQSLVMVASTPEVSSIQLQIGQDSDISLAANSMSMDTAGLSTLHTMHPSSQGASVTTFEDRMREQEQWLGVMEQTLENLETEVTKRFGQVKLILQQLKTGQECLKQQLQTLTPHQPEPTSLVTGKRPNTEGPIEDNGQIKRPRHT